VKAALKKLDRGGERIVFVVDEGDRLLGIITDSDIRRYILKDGSLGDTLLNCYNDHPIVLEEGFDHDAARQLMISNNKEIIPVVGNDGKLVDYVRWNDLFEETMERKERVEIPVVIMSGGKGTRLAPFTKILPKPLIPVGEKPIVEIIMDRFHDDGVTDFYLTVNYKGEMIKSYFDNTPVEYSIHYIWEEEFLGTAGSLKLLPETIANQFIVSNCDIIVDATYGDLVKYHNKSKHMLTVVGSIQHYKIPYGILECKKGGKLKTINEKPEYDMIVNTGLYVVNSACLKYIPDGREFHMTDLINLLLSKKMSVGMYPVSENAYMDIGQWEEYRKSLEKILPE
jgi:dTDP-glucose pyrophosphorylase